MRFEKADFERLFNLLHGACRVGYDYTLVTGFHTVTVIFAGTYIDDGFNDFVQELKNLSFYKFSTLDNLTLIFANPYFL